MGHSASQQVVFGPGAASNLERLLQWLVHRRSAPEFRIASKHITGDIEGNESGDQRLRLVIHTSGNVDAARFRSVPDLLAHRRSHDEIRRGHRAGSFEEKRVISNRISEMRCVRAKRAHEIPFSQWRDGIAGDYVGRYSTSAIDDPATVRVESLALGRNRVLGVVIAWQPTRNRSASRSEPARRRDLQTALTAEGNDRLCTALAIGRRADDDCAVVVLQSAGDDLRRAGAPPIDENQEWQVGPALLRRISVVA